MSPELKGKLDIYHALLLKWQKTINLVSPNTLNDAWQRHFEDSLQLLTHIPANTQTLWDLGSGAGFPGLVIAIARPDIAVTLVESDTRKSAFLQNVSRETTCGNVKVVNERIEAMIERQSAPDVITARALAALDKLFDWTQPAWQTNPDITMILPKGKNVSRETSDAEERFTFDYTKQNSVIDDESCILIVRNIAVK